jgi:hypothetical protein
MEKLIEVLVVRMIYGMKLFVYRNQIWNPSVQGRCKSREEKKLERRIVLAEMF